MKDYELKIKDANGNERYEHIRSYSEWMAIDYYKHRWLKEGETIEYAELF